MNLEDNLTAFPKPEYVAHFARYCYLPTLCNGGNNCFHRLHAVMFTQTMHSHQCIVTVSIVAYVARVSCLYPISKGCADRRWGQAGERSRRWLRLRRCRWTR